MGEQLTTEATLGQLAAKLRATLSPRAVLVLTHARWADRGWEPVNPKSPTIVEMVEQGLLRRADGRFFFEAFKDSFVVPTAAGLAARAALLAAPADNAALQPGTPAG